MKTATKNSTVKSRTPQIKKLAKTLSKEYGPVGQIVTLGRKGFTRQELIASGLFNKSTVHCQFLRYIGPAKR